MKSLRMERVNSLMKKELSAVLKSFHSGLSDFFITVTEVRVSRDLATSEIWVSILGDASKRNAGLRLIEKLKGKIRSEVARRVHLRRTPDLNFKLDDTLDRTARIDSILKKAGIEGGTEEDGDEN